MNKEIRISQFDNLSTEDMIVSGYAATYNDATVLYEIDGIQYKEVIARGAFDKTSFKDCCLKYNHADNYPILARTRGDSLKINIDNKGLFFEGRMFNTQAARDVYTLVKGGALDKCSFAFIVAPNGDSYDRNTRTRTITAIERVLDCSIVDIPAYDSTSVTARSFFKLEREKELMEISETERRKLKLKLMIDLEEF